MAEPLGNCDSSVEKNLGVWGLEGHTAYVWFSVGLSNTCVCAMCMWWMPSEAKRVSDGLELVTSCHEGAET